MLASTLVTTRSLFEEWSGWGCSNTGCRRRARGAGNNGGGSGSMQEGKEEKEGI
jgi:hypothetical protein